MYRYWKYYLRPLTPIVLVFFSWYSAEPMNYVQAAQATPVPVAGENTEAPGKASGGDFSDLIDDITETVGVLEQQTAQDERALPALDHLGDLRRQLDGAAATVQADFRAQREKLTTAGAPAEIFKRHAQAVASYESELRDLRQRLDTALALGRDLRQAVRQGSKAKTVSRGQEMSRLLQSMQKRLRGQVTPRPHAALDPKELPHRRPKSQDRKPRLQKAEFNELLGLKAAAGKIGAPAVAKALPTPADLAANEDIQITPAIQALANQLGNDPLRIYHWVHDNVEFIPSYGSIQGSQMTLVAKRGNACDTATLLIALLRAAGVPARYAMGTVEIPVAKVRNWLGDVESAQVAQQLLGQGGIPNVGLTQGGQITDIRLEHVWVQAWVDYVPSRGAKHQQGDTWVPLDPTFKLHQFIAPSGLATAKPFDLQGLATQLRAQAVRDDSLGKIGNIREDLILDSFEDYADVAGDYFSAHGLEPSNQALLGGQTIVPETAKVLPASLPYSVVTASDPVSTLPDRLRLSVTLNGFASSFDHAFGNPSFTYRVSLPSLNTRRLGITYEPATPADAQIITNAEASGATSLPLYLIHVRPVVTLDGTAVASGPSVGMGVFQFVDVVLQDVGETSTISYQMTAGDEGVFGITANGVTQELMQARFNAVPPNTGAENLQQAALHYWMESDFFDQLTARGLGVHALRRLSVGLFSCPLTASYLFGAPRNGFYASRFMDVKRSLVGVAGADPARVRTFVQQSGMFGSFAEGLVFDQLFSKNFVSRGFSAMELLGDANRRGIPLYFITRDNAAAVLPHLAVSSAVKTDILNSVGTGKTVLIPEREIDRGRWQGVGYIVQDEETGAGAYLISGGVNGGGWLDCHPVVRVLLEVIAFIILLAILALIIWAIVQSLGSLGPVLEPAFAAIIAMLGILVGTSPAYAGGGFRQGGQADPCNCPPLPTPRACETHTDHNHYPCVLPVPHWHYFTVHQGPAPECRESQVRRFGGCGVQPVGPPC